MINPTVNATVAELDIALERAMSAITASDGCFIDLAYRSARFNDLVITCAQRLGLPITSMELQDVVALTLLTGIVAERVMRGDK